MRALRSFAVFALLLVSAFGSFGRSDEYKPGKAPKATSASADKTTKPAGYPFAVPPDKALAMIQDLHKVSGTRIVITKDESALFADAGDGALDSWSFADSALIASGATDAAKRKALAAQLERLEADARVALADAKTPMEKGDKLLKFVHAGPMAKGYETLQTNLSTLLESGRFNCVSSAVLYNVLARRLELDVKAIEVPEHVLSVLYVEGKAVDVETTNAMGFNPKDPRRSSRREVGELGLAAIICYNHGVDLARDKRYHDALAANFRALALDRANPSAAKNALANLTTWSSELSQEGKYEEAGTVLTLGLQLAPTDGTLKNNQKVLWQDYIRATLKAGKDAEALTLIDRAAKALGDKDYPRQVAAGHVQEHVQARLSQREYAEALADITRYAPALGKSERSVDLSRMVYDVWANEHRAKKDWRAAVEVYTKALERHPGDRHLQNNAVATIDGWARTHMETRDWAAAIAVYEQGLRSFPGHGVLAQNLRYCQEQARK